METTFLFVFTAVFYGWGLHFYRFLLPYSMDGDYISIVFYNRILWMGTTFLSVFYYRILWMEITFLLVFITVFYGWGLHFYRFLLPYSMDGYYISIGFYNRILWMGTTFLSVFTTVFYGWRLDFFWFLQPYSMDGDYI